ncbi:glutamyl-tRNA synthetase [Epithele typhae]|uniref:glutamyl-tRNA synthetase n=1 Tax=Epithele typhae TaxID=378194 RepID=UPI00200821B3|nr:glutamyl-tRNA synthetase [Epithele typhae]KAH9927416.1 glutamyl-tRNA synthetase [Epithele typhae]
MATLLRFAPSPTGALHLGGLRTALYNHLFARRTGGKWILRIEDTDRTRAVPGAVEGISNALAWAGLEYDFGPSKVGPHGPYFQSERLDLYHKYADRLLQSGHAYRCFCSKDKLADVRERLQRTGSRATYDKSCLHLTEEEAARRARAGESYVIRFNDSNLPVRPPSHDLVFSGLKDAHDSLPTDPVLLKADKFPTYHLASVVDDFEMGITHVVRGEEWLPSLPLHLDLYAALSLPMPHFAHLPILLNPDGSKMSKRKGDVHVLDYAQRGWEPNAVLNWLALAGWGAQRASTGSTSHPSADAPSSTQLMSLEQLIQQFDFNSLTQRRSILDPLKLEHINKHHLMQLMLTPHGLNSSAQRAQPFVQKAFPNSPFTSVPYLERVVFTLQGRLTNLSDVPSLAPYLFEEPDYTAEEAQKMLRTVRQRVGLTDAQYAEVISDLIVRLRQASTGWDASSLAQMLHDGQATSGLAPKDFMPIVRHALTGTKSGPAIADTMAVLGPERTIARLERLAK